MIATDTVSIELLEEAGYQVNDGGIEEKMVVESISAEYMIKTLTKRQQKVASLLQDGYSRKQVAKELGVGLQAIHQIVPRIRKRLLKRGTIPEDTPSHHKMRVRRADNVLAKNVVWMYWLVKKTEVTSVQIFGRWKTDPVLMDYPQPELLIIDAWLKEFKNDYEKS